MDKKCFVLPNPTAYNTNQFQHHCDVFPGGVSKPSESGRNVRKNSLMELEMHEMTSSVRGGHASGNNNDDDYSGHDDGIVSNGSGNNSPTSGGGEDDNVEDIMKQMFKVCTP